MEVEDGPAFNRVQNTNLQQRGANGRTAGRHFSLLVSYVRKSFRHTSVLACGVRGGGL